VRDIPALVKAMKIHATIHPSRDGTVPVDRHDLVALCHAIEAEWACVKALTDTVEALKDRVIELEGYR
jgi:hypothetical protein